MREKGGRGKKVGESGKRELRKTPEGKLRKAKKEREGKKKDREGERRGMRREQFPLGGEQKTQNCPFS